MVKADGYKRIVETVLCSTWLTSMDMYSSINLWQTMVFIGVYPLKCSSSHIRNWIVPKYRYALDKMTDVLHIVKFVLLSLPSIQTCSKCLDGAEWGMKFNSHVQNKSTSHYELPMEKKVPWNGAVSMRSRAGCWETLSICITLRHNQAAPADMHANALGILIICRFPLA